MSSCGQGKEMGRHFLSLFTRQINVFKYRFILILLHIKGTYFLNIIVQKMRILNFLV